ncbi:MULTISPECIES: DUF3272 family protein [unclassified Lactococcus]|uniref:DUF3272 family protein n=1 Tax=unclassified Lactococcus TaxID=2643510 RepID=UPI0011C99E6D|nr:MULTISPECIES: DUF3272 family protein [unclassified Lactococcus]MQW22397.1 DUF3272 family protein [Lactococcus sp. dk101]TXK45432.1 DUF3272 family protein [Lactococcus sp. dk310]TXK51765.1 DUF3272 family protein [Lactococcus sp. dk322]
MPKQRFLSFIIGTAVEAIFFSICLFSRDWLFAGFFALFLIRRLSVSYKLDKFIKKSGLL